MKMAILWQHMGPYHFSRFSELKKIHPTAYLVEIADNNTTYSWARKGAPAEDFYTLFPGEVAESVIALRVFFRIRNFLHRQKIEVLFVPSYWPSYALAAVFAAKSLGLRTVFMGDSHYASGSNTGTAIIIKRLLIRAYDAALVAGSIHKNFLRYLGMPRERVFDGYDTVDNHHFSKLAQAARGEGAVLRGRLGLPEHYFLSLGRLVEKKNLETVVYAYAQLVKRGCHAGHSLVFVGSGSGEEKLMDLSKELGLEIIKPGGSIAQIAEASDAGRVYFFPFAQIDVVPAYYAFAATFILASRSDEWGLVVNEAMACACPVLVSRSVGSSLDLVMPNITGHRFSAESINELSWCMEKMCMDLPRSRAMGEAAQRHIADWSNERFAINAARAAYAALDKTSASAQTESSFGLRRNVWFLQTCFPDYRMPVFTRLHERLGNDFHLFSGTSYFTPDVRTTTDFLDWHSLVENRFIFGRGFLWQAGACDAMFHAQVVVMELNPRILSTWVILATRALWGAPTLLWGHAWGRGDSLSIRNVLRLYMMRLSSGTITYTRSQREEVKRVLPRLRVYTATNSLIRAADCAPFEKSANELDTILYVGRLNSAKKPRLLVAGFLRAKLPDNVVLKLVGDGIERVEIEKNLTEHKRGNRVEFLGHVHNHEILKSLYGRAFCSVSPGYVGLGAIQSFSFGVPLVLSDNEPHAPEVEACCEGQNTLRFTSDDVDSLASSLERMWAERAEWLSRRSALASWTAKHYSVEAMVEGFIDAIEAVAPCVGYHSEKV